MNEQNDERHGPEGQQPDCDGHAGQHSAAGTPSREGSVEVALEQTDLKQDVVDATLGAILKHQEDVSKVGGGLSRQLISAAGDGN